MPQNSYRIQASQELDNNSRDIRFSMNQRDLKEPIPVALQKTSPYLNMDGESDYQNEKNDNVNQIKDLKKQLDNKRRKVKFIDHDDEMVEGRRWNG